MIRFSAPFTAPKKPKIPQAATPEGDREATAKADEEARRRARAMASTARRDSILTGNVLPGASQRKTFLGS